MFKKLVLAGMFFSIGLGTSFAVFTNVKTSTLTAEAVINFPAEGTMDVGFGKIDGAGIDAGVTVTSITWSGIVATTTWKASDVVLIVTNTYRNLGWAIRIYTDNTNAAASPIWNTNLSTMTDCAGLLPVSASSATYSLPMCWRITDNTTDTYSIKEGTSTSGAYLYDASLGSDFRCFFFIKDKETPDKSSTADVYEGFFEGTPSNAAEETAYKSVIVLKGGLGFHYTSGLTDSDSWALPADNTTYIYIGTNFTNATTSTTYKTNQFKLELFTE